MTPPSQTELEKALTEIRRLSQCSKYYIEQFEFIEAAAKRIPALEAKLKEVETERDEFEGMLKHIARSYCGIEIGKPLEGIDEAETDVSMVAAFVEGTIDEQAFRADKAQQERDQLRADYKLALEALKENRITVSRSGAGHVCVGCGEPFQHPHKDFCLINKALSTPSAIAAMKGEV